jgi:mono/diheme cytochrome c family protein
MSRFAVAFLIFGPAAVLAGCGAPDAGFQRNLIYLNVQEETAQTDLTPQQEQDIQDVLVAMFGTPDEPRLPAFESVSAGAVLDIEKLGVAAGPIGRDRNKQLRGMYREHCALCHGIAGDGAGPVAAFMNPYPRDFRRGTFKFKSTEGPGTPPTDSDLKAILENGMPGTAMPAFRLLGDDQIDALVAYVKHLSIRGEVERFLIVESVDRVESAEDRLIDMSLEGKDPTAYSEQMSEVETLVSFVLQKWIDAPGRVVRVPPKPEDWDLEESIRRGQELFLGQVANCLKCHGPEGLGDGQTDDFDEWTKEVFDPQNPDAGRAYLALGALKPRKIRPRNLRQGIFHGGSRPDDLYLRIHNGIPGTPMPAAPMKSSDASQEDKRLTTDDIWHLVDFVLNLPSAPPIDAKPEELTYAD